MRYGHAIGVPTRRAIWNKGADGVMKQIKAIQQALPFTVTIEPEATINP